MHCTTVASLEMSDEPFSFSYPPLFGSPEYSKSRNIGSPFLLMSHWHSSSVYPFVYAESRCDNHDYGHRCIANAWRVVCWQCAHKHFNVCCRQFPKMESERERKTDGHAKNVHKREMIMVWRDIGAIVSGRLRITRWLNPLSSISVLRASLNSCSIIMLSLSVISVVF